VAGKNTPEGRVKTIIKKQLARLESQLDTELHMHMPSANRFGSSGDPDFRFTLWGVQCHIEAKTEGKKPTERQRETIRTLRRAGAFAIVVTGEDEARALLETLVPALAQHILYMSGVLCEKSRELRSVDTTPAKKPRAINRLWEK